MRKRLTVKIGGLTGVIHILRDGNIVGYDDVAYQRLVVDNTIHNYENDRHRELLLTTLYDPEVATVPDTTAYHARTPRKVTSP